MPPKGGGRRVRERARAGERGERKEGANVIERHSEERETVKGRGNCEPLTASLSTSSEGLLFFLGLFLICCTIWNRSVQSLTVLIFLLEFLISKCVLHCARSAGVAVNLLWLTGRRELTRTEAVRRSSNLGTD